MKKNILGFLLGAIALSGTAQTTIDFSQLSFAELKAKAKQENKLIFIDTYTSWCKPCKEMEKNVFTDSAVYNYYNKNFINTKVDTDQGEGKEIAEMYHAKCVPTFLFVDGGGKLMHSRSSAMSVKEFIQLGETALNPLKRLAYYTDLISSKKSDAQFFREYLSVLYASSCLLPPSFGKDELGRAEILKEYFNTQKDEDLISRGNWNTIYSFSDDYKSREFIYLLKNADSYRRQYTSDSVNQKIKEVLTSSGRQVIYKKGATAEEYPAFVNEVKGLGGSNSDEALFWLNLTFNEKNNKWPEYQSLVLEKGDKYLRSAEDKNTVSKTIADKFSDELILKKAESLMQNAVQKEPIWTYYETYANVLFKLKKKEEAKTAANKAIEQAKNAGLQPENYNSVTYLLERIEKM